MCLGKHKKAVSFTTPPDGSDQKTLVKKTRLDFQHCIESDCDIVLQLKDEAWNDFVDLKDEAIADKSVLQFFTK